MSFTKFISKEKLKSNELKEIKIITDEISNKLFKDDNTITVIKKIVNFIILIYLD